jgi:hypothetical protein
MASEEDDNDNWPTSGKQFALPQRDETDFGKAQERGMSLVGLGDFGKIRTVEWEGPSGWTSVHRLRTRGGWPVFEEDIVEPGDPLSPRGFVAKVHNGRAILFNPYTLDILITPYLPAVNEYTVLDFATDWNVPPTDTTGWNDVVLFNGQEIRINNLAMPSLGITADHGYLAVPYVINRNDNSDQYGNAIRNETEKRVFAIGREKATTWGGAGETVILEPQGPRNAAIRTALTIGQKLNFTDDSAQIGQLFYPWEDLYPWYDDNVEWYFTSAHVQMLLASTYLVKTQGNANVVMSSPPFDDLGYVTGTKQSSVSFGTTDIGASGASYHISPSSYAGGGSDGIIRYGMDDVVKGSIVGFFATNYYGYHYGGSIAETETVAGVTVEYTGFHDFRADTRGNYYGYPAQYLSFGVDVSNYTWLLNADAVHLFWGIVDTGADPSITTPYRGVPGRYLGGKSFNSVHIGTGTIQEGNFLVTANGRDIIVIDYLLDEYSGEGMSWSPNITYYQPYFKQDMWSSYGWGFAAEAIYGNYNTGGSSPVSDYKRIAGVQDPSVIAEIEAEWDKAKAALLTQRYYDCEASSGFYDRPSANNDFYLFTKIPAVTTIIKTLTWETHDFILHDETNGVYIEIVGRYSGSSSETNNVGSVDLTIHLEIETRYDQTSILLKTYTFGTVGFPDPIELWPGIYGISPPKVRGIFAPLHQTQGSFKGGHYVELSEEANGAQPVHLFNFILRLLTYYDIPEANELNDTTDIVYFVPCNLIEMLYAIVYSSEFGVNAFERYPVTFPVRYTEITTTLFAERFRIAVRDGAEGVWSDVFGADFAATGEITLHRT